MADDCARLRRELECESMPFPRRGALTAQLNACILGLLAVAATVVVARSRSLTPSPKQAKHSDDDPLFTLL